MLTEYQQIPKEPFLSAKEQETHKCELAVQIGKVPLNYTLDYIKKHFDSQGKIVQNIKVMTNRQSSNTHRCIYMECETKQIQHELITEPQRFDKGVELEIFKYMTLSEFSEFQQKKFRQRVYLPRLDLRITNGNLKKIFSQFGKVFKAFCVKDSNFSETLKFGTIYFHSEESIKNIPNGGIQYEGMILEWHTYESMHAEKQMLRAQKEQLKAQFQETKKQAKTEERARNTKETKKLKSKTAKREIQVEYEYVKVQDQEDADYEYNGYKLSKTQAKKVEKEYNNLMKKNNQLGFNPETMSLTPNDQLIYDLQKAYNRFEDPEMHSTRPTSNKFHRNFYHYGPNLVTNQKQNMGKILCNNIFGAHNSNYSMNVQPNFYSTYYPSQHVPVNFIPQVRLTNYWF